MSAEGFGDLKRPAVDHARLGTTHYENGRHKRYTVGADVRSIANPYFIPDSRLIEMPATACRRGVTVKLLLAGRHNDTDGLARHDPQLVEQLRASFSADLERCDRVNMVVLEGPWRLAARQRSLRGADREPRLANQPTCCND